MTHYWLVTITKAIVDHLLAKTVNNLTLIPVEIYKIMQPGFKKSEKAEDSMIDTK